MRLTDIAQGHLELTFAQVVMDKDLVRDIQKSLADKGLLPPHAIDGAWGQLTESAVSYFCKSVNLNNHTTGLFGATFASSLLYSARQEINYFLIAKIVGCPATNVQTHLPSVIQALKHLGIYSPQCLIAAIATIGTETPNFAPVREIGSVTYFTKMYEGRLDLGNLSRGDGAKYCGRGLIQITGRSNYKNYGLALGIDLVKNPDLALNPDISARILALYFKNRKIHILALDGNWQQVRKVVNGGTNGWDRFITLVENLLKERLYV